MRSLAATLLVFALAAPTFAQDRDENRMNEPYPTELGPAAPTPGETPWLDQDQNRMNEPYPETGPVQKSGEPDPYGNRMNEEAPKPAQQVILPVPFPPSPYRRE
jgi:hypothetical protein